MANITLIPKQNILLEKKSVSRDFSPVAQLCQTRSDPMAAAHQEP